MKTSIATVSISREFPEKPDAIASVGFDGGAIGTLSMSDTVVAPWSWELSSGENPAYPDTNTASYSIGVTRGSFSIPDLRIWRYAGQASWREPFDEDPDQRK